MKNPLNKNTAALFGAYTLATLSISASFVFGFAALLPLALSTVSNDMTEKSLTYLEKGEGGIKQDWQDISPYELMLSAVNSFRALFSKIENGSPKDTLEGEQSGDVIKTSEEPRSEQKMAEKIEPTYDPDVVFSSEELGAENALQSPPHFDGKKLVKKEIH